MHLQEVVLGDLIFDRVNEFQIKKILIWLEIRLQDISNELSHAQFEYREGLQKSPAKCTM